MLTGRHAPWLACLNFVARLRMRGGHQTHPVPSYQIDLPDASFRLAFQESLTSLVTVSGSGT